MTLSPALRRILPALVIFGVVPLVVACVPGVTGPGGASPTPAPPLTPAPPGADPVSLLSWLFTPIFQAMFIIMVGEQVCERSLSYVCAAAEAATGGAAVPSGR